MMWSVITSALAPLLLWKPRLWTEQTRNNYTSSELDRPRRCLSDLERSLCFKCSGSGSAFCRPLNFSKLVGFGNIKKINFLFFYIKKSYILQAKDPDQLFFKGSVKYPDLLKKDADLRHCLCQEDINQALWGQNLGSY